MPIIDDRNEAVEPGLRDACHHDRADHHLLIDVRLFPRSPGQRSCRRRAGADAFSAVDHLAELPEELTPCLARSGKSGADDASRVGFAVEAEQQVGGRTAYLDYQCMSRRSFSAGGSGPWRRRLTAARWWGETGRCRRAAAPSPALPNRAAPR